MRLTKIHTELLISKGTGFFIRHFTRSMSAPISFLELICQTFLQLAVYQACFDLSVIIACGELDLVKQMVIYLERVTL